jgi:TPR repeat protein
MFLLVPSSSALMVPLHFALDSRGVPQDNTQAAFWYRKAAEQGNAAAQDLLGSLYEHGLGVPKDFAQAAIWYRKAAEQGDADAQSELGEFYEGGAGVPADYAQAASWYRRAAEQGDAEAQLDLGLLYWAGNGVPQDYAEAYFWLDIALASSGKLPYPAKSDYAVKTRSNAASHLTPADLSRIQERARKWFENHTAKP